MTELLTGATLSEAQKARAKRADLASEKEAGLILERAGITKEKCLELKIDPAEYKKLRGIIARLRKLPHPFTTCMRDLRKHKPEWTEDRRKRTCQSLKIAAGRKDGGKTTASSVSEGACVLLTDGMVTLLEHANFQEA